MPLLQWVCERPHHRFDDLIPLLPSDTLLHYHLLGARKVFAGEKSEPIIAK